MSIGRESASAWLRRLCLSLRVWKGPRMKTIVVASDGTGSGFGMPGDEKNTNVCRLVHHLYVEDCARQVVIYDPGLGAHHWRPDPDFEAQTPGLKLLGAPPWWAWHKRLAAATIGIGLAENVEQILTSLSDVHKQGDTLAMFGFSRGAFTVRAVAAMLHRFGLPVGNHDQKTDLIRGGWKLLKVLNEKKAATEIKELRDKHRRVKVEFLGLWDSVKSYGGLWPILLPHLRHNPSIATVRHAVSLDERRAWFLETTWGRLDRDRPDEQHPDRPMAKLVGQDLERVEAQDICELWFSGFHNDIGSGATALRWMLAEAALAVPSLVLTGAAYDFLDRRDSGDEIGADSMHLGWWLTERIPRFEPFNDQMYPRREFRLQSNGRRVPEEKLRGSVVHFHDSANPPHPLNTAIERSSTPKVTRPDPADCREPG